MKERMKKFLSILTIISVLFVQTVPVYAEDPSINSGQSPSPTPSPSAQTTTEQADTTPSPSPASSPQESVSSTPTPTAPAPENNTNASPADSAQIGTPERTGPLSDAEREQRKAEAKAAWEQQFLAQHPELDKTNGSNGNTGTTVLKTGNATNSSAGVTSGNANGLRGSSGQANGVAAGASVANAANGAVSNNASVVTNGASVSNDQTNSAKVGNNVNQSSVTGKSSTSFNVGDSTLTTGDANVSGTAVTGVNTNLSNVQISEFNVVDNQKGDLILSPEAFAGNCIAGCSGSGLSAANTGNGAKSTNSANATNNLDTTTNQMNNAGVGNNLTLAANSGDNAGSFNTGGNTIINTGDANVSANSLTFANNNLAGNVTFGVINIYGNLEGDIVLPEFASVGPSGSTSNTNNGAASTNTASSNTSDNTNTFQNNDVTIANNVTVDGTTGGNSSSDNTTGNTTINTGKTTTDTNVLNVTNTNISDGTWWLVLVNHAGNWVGKLLGAPDGATMAGSSGTEFKTDANGHVTASNGSAGSPQGPSTSSGQTESSTATNNGNGAASNNDASVSNSTNTNTTQNNNADIENNLNLSANTGRNKADFNTGGHNTINTGDSNIIANLVNFVNNNISGSGRLVVTVVNVFGSWAGDFVTPGQQKQNKTASSTPSSSAQGSEGQETASSNTDNTTSSSQQQNNSSASGQTPQTGRTERIVSGFKAAPDGATQSASSNGNETVKVAGISTSDTNQLNAVAGTNEKIIKINLAWVLLLLPLVVFALLRKRQNAIKVWKK